MLGSPPWGIIVLSLAWLGVGNGVSLAALLVGFRSRARARHAMAWGWLAFVLGSQGWATRRLLLGARCGMSYEDVVMTVVWGGALGGLCMGAIFLLVRARCWGSPRSAAVAAVAAAIFVTVFFGELVGFWFSDPCFPRDFEI